MASAPNQVTWDSQKMHYGTDNCNPIDLPVNKQPIQCLLSSSFPSHLVLLGYYLDVGAISSFKMNTVLRKCYVLYFCVF